MLVQMAWIKEGRVVQVKFTCRRFSNLKDGNVIIAF